MGETRPHFDTDHPDRKVLPDNRRGGPRTAEGKARSRSNSLRHGLTARDLLEDKLGSERLERHKSLLRDEWRPQSRTEELLVVEMARHAAALDLVEEAEPAVLRYGCGSSTSLILPPGDATEADACLASAVTTDAAERVTRYRRAHEKGLYTALKRLQELRAVRPTKPGTNRPTFSASFTDEASCATYLRERLLAPSYCCTSCGREHGHWLTNRQRRECAQCGRQAASYTRILAHALSLDFRSICSRQRRTDVHVSRS